MHYSPRPRIQEIGVNFLLPCGPSRIMGLRAWGSKQGSPSSLDAYEAAEASHKPTSSLLKFPHNCKLRWAIFSHG